MIDQKSQRVVNLIIQRLDLSETALTGSRTEPHKAVPAILIGWRVVAEYCVKNDEKWKFKNSPPEATLLAGIEEIYSTNWPNKCICRAFQTFYDASPQDWWEVKDIRDLLDLAIHSALAATYTTIKEMKELGLVRPPDQRRD